MTTLVMIDICCFIMAFATGWTCHSIYSGNERKITVEHVIKKQKETPKEV